jgi:hypothetical protein
VRFVAIVGVTRDQAGGGVAKDREGVGSHGKAARVADQIRATELLLAYGWGKPAAYVPIEGADPLELDEVAA